jgi:hypothetical protein
MFMRVNSNCVYQLSPERVCRPAAMADHRSAVYSACAALVVNARLLSIDPTPAPHAANSPTGGQGFTLRLQFRRNDFSQRAGSFQNAAIQNIAGRRAAIV